MSDKIVLFQVRVLFSFKDSNDKINFKIITDTDEGISKFIDTLKGLENISKIAVEYLCEYDCSRIGEVKKVFNVEV